jgi:aspartate carbamoyltransferase regulatory subunit
MIPTGPNPISIISPMTTVKVIHDAVIVPKLSISAVSDMYVERQSLNLPGRESQLMISVHHCVSSGKVVTSRLVVTKLARCILFFC